MGQREGRAEKGVKRDMGDRRGIADMSQEEAGEEGRDVRIRREKMRRD